MTADVVAHAALHWCRDDSISYDEEQQHISGDDVAVPAIVRPHQLSSSSDRTAVMKKFAACTKNSHSVCCKLYCLWQKQNSMERFFIIVGRTTIKTQQFYCDTGVPTPISKDIGTAVATLYGRTSRLK